MGQYGPKMEQATPVNNSIHMSIRPNSSRQINLSGPFPRQTVTLNIPNGNVSSKESEEEEDDKETLRSPTGGIAEQKAVLSQLKALVSDSSCQLEDIKTKSRLMGRSDNVSGS